MRLTDDDAHASKHDHTLITTDYTGQQNFFFLAYEEKYLILIELLTLNSNV